MGTCVQPGRPWQHGRGRARGAPAAGHPRPNPARRRQRSVHALSLGPHPCGAASPAPTKRHVIQPVPRAVHHRQALAAHKVLVLGRHAGAAHRAQDHAGEALQGHRRGLGAEAGIHRARSSVEQAERGRRRHWGGASSQEGARLPTRLQMSGQGCQACRRHADARRHS